MHVRICRDCGEEYRPEIATCADCGGELEDVWDRGAGEGPDSVPSQPPPERTIESRGRPQAVLTGDRAADVEGPARELGAAGIPFAVKVQHQAFALLVGELDVEAASRCLKPWLGEAPPEAGRPAEACPACGHAIPAGAAECPDCGLALETAEPDP